MNNGRQSEQGTAPLCLNKKHMNCKIKHTHSHLPPARLVFSYGMWIILCIILTAIACWVVDLS